MTDAPRLVRKSDAQAKPPAGLPADVVEKFKQSWMQLEVLAPILNRVSDEFNTEIRNLEAHLRGMNLGVSSTVLVPNAEKLYLGYGKVGDQWGFTILKDGLLENKGTQLFLEAPRHLRIKAVAALPDLLTQMANDATTLEKEIVGAIETLASVKL